MVSAVSVSAAESRTSKRARVGYDGRLAFRRPGALPFVHENPLALLLLHRDTLPAPPRSRNPSLLEAVQRIILRCLEKDPGRRFGSCRELGQCLLAVRSR